MFYPVWFSKPWQRVHDNCDDNPESQFAATMHCTNDIAIQELVPFE